MSCMNHGKEIHFLDETQSKWVDKVVSQANPAFISRCRICKSLFFAENKQVFCSDVCRKNPKALRVLFDKPYPPLLIKLLGEQKEVFITKCSICNRTFWSEWEHLYCSDACERKGIRRKQYYAKQIAETRLREYRNNLSEQNGIQTPNRNAIMQKALLNSN
jgi:hypothetical protein